MDPSLLPAAERENLARARDILEHPGLAVRLADKVGAPIGKLARRLPRPARALVEGATRRALQVALAVALRSLGGAPSTDRADRLHRLAAMASGALGGAAGLVGLFAELPVTTTLMLRAIADQARAQGEDLSAPEARLECLAVFAYGSRPGTEDAPRSAYYVTRAALARALGRAGQLVAQRGVAGALGERSAPALVELVARVAERLGVAVTDKVAAEVVPLVGAVGGAAVNALFMNHYQDVAWAHFTVRRLERAYGAVPVRELYLLGA